MYMAGLNSSAANMPKYGTVDWRFREYKISRAYLDKVGVRSRDDYEWAMDQVGNTLTKKGDRIRDRLVKTITPRAADKLCVSAWNKDPVFGVIGIQDADRGSQSNAD